MPKNVTVEIRAEAHDQAAAANGLARQPVSIDLQLTPNADSHSEAIVLVLRHAADVAAARFGLLEQIKAPKAIEELLDDMIATMDGVEPAIGGMVRNWANRLAAEYGLVIRDGRPVDLAA